MAPIVVELQYRGRATIMRWYRSSRHSRSPAAPEADSQASLGEYAGSYFKKQREAANEKRRAEFWKKWRVTLEARRNERKA